MPVARWEPVQLERQAGRTDPRRLRRRPASWLFSIVLGLCATPLPSSADVPLEQIGGVETLPRPGPHWVWVADVVLQRNALLDLDAGSFLGMISTGLQSQAAAFPRGRREFYVPETYYSRGTRGVRTDVVSVYDSTTLAAVDEVIIPPKRAINILPTANLALSDDDRFLAVFNMTPATSLSIVDTQERRFVEEIATPGCSLAYAAGRRRFLMLCSDGSFLSVLLDAAGRRGGLVRGERFFDPVADPVTEKAVRYGDVWLFVSFAGRVHPLDVSGETPRVGEPWSLLDESDRDASWRVGGGQHLAVHQGTGRLYSLMHRGGADTHKQAGSEVWVYDLATRKRVERLKLRHPGLSFLSEDIGFGASWVWPLNRIWGWLLDTVVPNPGLDLVQVTQDEEPLLVTGSQLGGSIAVYDALSLRFLRRVPSGNLTSHVLQAPWRGPGMER